MRDRLKSLIVEGSDKVLSIPYISEDGAEALADFLIYKGVIVSPCVAMVEQFIKDGKFDKKHTAYNGRYAVVYVDNSTWSCPLIDITEQFYDTEKAEKRMQALERSENERNSI